MLLESYIAGFASLALAAAAVVAPSDDGRPANARKGLKLDFEVLLGNSKQDASRHNKPKLSKRKDNAALYEITNVANYYQAVVQLGSNKEECKVLLDTDSSYLWVMGQDVACRGRPDVYGWGDEELKKRDSSGVSDDGGFEGYTTTTGAGSTTTGAGSTTTGAGSTTTGAGSVSAAEYSLTDTASGSAYDFPATTSRARYNDTAGRIIRNASAAAYEEYSLTTGFPDSSESDDYGWESGLGSGWEWIDETATIGGTCTALGTFNTDGSDTFQVNETASSFIVHYTDQSSATGVWGSDTVGFANEHIRLSFGVANYSMSEVGVLGIGSYFESDEFNSTSNNFPIQLKEQNIINKAAYSLFLNKNSSRTGSVLFGAVDHNKYTGQLQTLPMVNVLTEFNLVGSPIVALNGIHLESADQNVTVMDEPIGAGLITRSTLSALPQAVVDALASSFSANTSHGSSLPVVDCAYKKTQGHIVFNFSGAFIKVPVGDFILEVEDRCFLGVRAIPSSRHVYASALLGVNVLRNAYVVYDLEAKEISLAQANYTDDEDVEAITSTVPSAVKAPGYSATSLSSEVSSRRGDKFKSRASRSFPSALLLPLVLGMLCRIMF